MFTSNTQLHKNLKIAQKNLKESRGERKTGVCQRNLTIHPKNSTKYPQTKSNQTQTSSIGPKFGPKQPAKVPGGSTMPIGHRLPPKIIKLKSKKGF